MHAPATNREKLLTLAALSLVLLACSTTDEPAKSDAAADAPADAPVGNDSSADAATAQSIACYIAVQFRCKEFPEATADQLTNLPVECSSASGVLSNPAACPRAGYVGQCAVGGTGFVPGTGPGREVRRFYTGVDVAYEEDFCVNTAGGKWSTLF